MLKIYTTIWTASMQPVGVAEYNQLGYWYKFIWITAMQPAELLVQYTTIWIADIHPSELLV